MATIVFLFADFQSQAGAKVSPNGQSAAGKQRRRLQKKEPHWMY
jgi:hypothetical protein